jgi:hypothetical protein
MPDGPIAYAKLVDVNLDQPRRQLQQHFRKRGEDDAQEVSALLHKAYVEGLRDGFVQGVAAAEAVTLPSAQEEAGR